MNIRLIVAGKTKPLYLAEGVADYMKRLKRYADVEIVVVRSVPERSNQNRKYVLKKEAERILSKIDKGTFVIVLDRAGRLITSMELAQVFRHYQESGVRSWTFVIGGALGLAPDVIKRADLLLAISKMTFTHDMTRLILVEQIYRAMTINQGEPYHR